MEGWAPWPCGLMHHVWEDGGLNLGPGTFLLWGETIVKIKDILIAKMKYAEEGG